MATIKRILRISGIVLVAFICVALIYCGVVISVAKYNTPRIVNRAMHSPDMDLNVSDLTAQQVKAFLLVEDPDFYHHKGVDLKTPGAGLTTITQSLVKMLYFDSFKPGFAKLKQTLIAYFVVNRVLSKDDQLRLYINKIYLGNVKGNPVFGFRNAAKAYYNKQLGDLSEDEYCSIIAMLVAPKIFNIITKPEANAERTRRIRLVVHGEYKPKAVMDIFYGKLEKSETQGLAPASYFPKLYE